MEARAASAAGDSGPTDSAMPLPPWSSATARGGRRGPRPQLDRERIVTAALLIVDAVGTNGLSFRRLADDLGVSAMALYWHVGDKAELLELVGHRVLDEVEMPLRRGDWRDQLREVHRALLATALRHPNTADILIGRARYGASGLVLFERILSVLLEAGFSPEAAFDAYQSLYLFTLGFMATSSRSPEFREIQRQGVVYMASLPEERFPAVRAVVPVIGRRTLEAQFEIGLDIQIAGIEAVLAPTRPAAQDSPSST